MGNDELKPWRRMGGNGTYIQLYGTEGLWGCYVVEVPGADALKREVHLYEEILLVVEGRGTTEVWAEGSAKKHVFEWQTGSLFTIPMNTCHRIVNAGSTPALLLAATTAPNMINLVRNIGLIFNCRYTFTDRYNEGEDYFKPTEDIEPDPLRGLAMRRTNIIPDASMATYHSKTVVRRGTGAWNPAWRETRSISSLASTRTVATRKLMPTRPQQCSYA